MIGDIYRNNDMATSGTTVISTMIKRMPTSINIDENLWAELKILAIKKKTTATDLLEQALKEFMAKEARGESSKKK